MTDTQRNNVANTTQPAAEKSQTDQHSEATSEIPSCTHILPEGRPCRSHALRNEQFCFYHQPTRPGFEPKQTLAASAAFDIPAPEDHLAIRAGLAIVLSRVARARIDLPRARVLLYGLQIVAQLLPKTTGPFEGAVADLELDRIEKETRFIISTNPQRKIAFEESSAKVPKGWLATEVQEWDK